MERLPRPILFVGLTEGAIAWRLHTRGNAGLFAPGEPEAVARWIEDVLRAESSLGHTPGERLPDFAAQVSRLQRWLVECADTPSGTRVRVHKHVACRMHRAHEARILRFVAQFAAQVGDLHIHCPVEHLVLPLTDLLQKVAARFDRPSALPASRGCRTHAE